MTNCCGKSCQLLGDFTFEGSKMNESWNELITGTGTSTWKNNGYVELQTSIQNDRVVRQTKQYFPARTHKFKKCMFTCVLNMINNNGYTSRIGTFDDHNDKTAIPGDVGGSGLFFEYTDDVLYVGIRYGTIDNGTDTLISQTNFNANNLMRNSHISIAEWTKVYTFEILFNSIGHVEWAIYLDGERLILHKEQDISRVLNTLPRYNLPLRLEIVKNINDTGATTGELRQFNSSICYEIGYSLDDAIGNKCKLKHLSDISSIAFNITSPNYKPMFSIRLKDTFIRNTILHYELLYMLNKPGPFMYAIVKNPTFTNLQPVWVDPDSDCRLEYDTTADEIDINNLDIIYEDFVFANCHIGAQSPGAGFLDKLCLPSISSGIVGTADIFTIIAKKMSPQNVVLRFNFRWVE